MKLEEFMDTAMEGAELLVLVLICVISSPILILMLSLGFIVGKISRLFKRGKK